MVQFDGLRPARLKVGIISAGRVGTALGVALERADHVVVACSAISHASRQRAAAPAARHPGAARRRGRRGRRAVAAGGSRQPNSPAWYPAWPPPRRCGPERSSCTRRAPTAIGILAPLAEQGCIPLAIHPAMTFTGSDEDISRLPDTCFGITAADEVGYAIAQSLVLEMGGEPFCVREDARMLYHAALAHAGNHIVAVVADALDALRAALRGSELLGQQLVDDQPGGIAERVVGPLARAALENTLQRGQAALTGPVARGDAAAVAEHLAALDAGRPAAGRGVSGERAADRAARACARRCRRGAGAVTADSTKPKFNAGRTQRLLDSRAMSPTSAARCGTPAAG